MQWSTDSAFLATEEVVLVAASVVNYYRLPDSYNRSVLSYNITGLTPGQKYFVRVAGVNVMGVPPPQGCEPLRPAPLSPCNSSAHVTFVTITNEQNAIRGYFRHLRTR